MKLHLDFDSYFVNAERSRNKKLLNKPCVVCTKGDDGFFDKNASFSNEKISFISNITTSKIDNEDYKNCIVISASYEAKTFGIKTTNKLDDAFKKCPHLKAVKSDLKFYKELSYKVKIFLESKFPVIEQFSIDEFFADLEGFKKDDEIYEYAKNIQNELLKKFNLPASIGISKSKWSAKLLTNLAKPFGIKMEKDIKNILKNIDIKHFAGIGKNTENYLRSYNINTLEELVKNAEILNKFGKNGTKLLARVLGEDDEKVGNLSNLKSHTISKSFKPINDIAELKRRIKILSRYLSIWIYKNNFHPRKLEIYIKYNKKSENVIMQMHQPFFEKNLIDLALNGFENLLKSINIKNVKIYFISLSVSDLKTYYTEDIFTHNKSEKILKLNETIIKIREKFGINCIKYYE